MQRSESTEILHDELIALAFSFLPQENLAQASLVCRQWNLLTKSHILPQGNDIYMLISVRPEYLPGSLAYSFAYNLPDLEKALKNGNFNYFPTAQFSDNNVLKNFLAEFAQHRFSGRSRNLIHFLAQCSVKENKLSINSCESYHGSGIEGEILINFATPITVDKRGVYPDQIGYKDEPPINENNINEIKQWRKEHPKRYDPTPPPKQKRTRANVTEPRVTDNPATQFAENKSTERKNEKVDEIKPVEKEKEKEEENAPKPAQQPRVSSNPATQYGGKPTSKKDSKPIPPPVPHPKGDKGSGSCSIS